MNDDLRFILLANQDDYYCLVGCEGNYATRYLYLIPKSSNGFVLNSLPSSELYDVYVYSKSTYESNLTGLKKYEAPYTSSDFAYQEVTVTDTSINTSVGYGGGRYKAFMSRNFAYTSNDFSLGTGKYLFVSVNTQYPVTIHSSLSLLIDGDRGRSPYFYNNSVWSNYVNNSSGDYTVNNSNVNTVTYGEIRKIKTKPKKINFI